MLAEALAQERSNIEVREKAQSKVGAIVGHDQLRCFLKITYKLLMLSRGILNARRSPFLATVFSNELIFLKSKKNHWGQYMQCIAVKIMVTIFQVFPVS